MINSITNTISSYRRSGSSGGDADAAAFISAAQITDATIIAAINTLVVSLKTANLWGKYSGKAIFPIVSDGVSQTRDVQHSYNLINPATFQLTYSAAMTHAATGMKSTGALSSLAGSTINASVDFTLNSMSLQFYLRNNVVEANPVGGWQGAGGVTRGHFYPRFTGDLMFAECYGTTNRLSVASPASDGLMSFSRTDATTLKGFRNGVQIGATNSAATSVTPANSGLVLGANPGNGSALSTREMAFVGASGGLTDGEMASLYTIIQTFETTLGRQV
jgi:hypothetical protein